MKRLVFIIVIASFVFTPFTNFAQSNYSAENQTRAINMHFLGDQLKGIAQNEPVRYSAIHYYFKSSFLVEDLNCSTCDVDMDQFFNQALFDVTDYEASRLATEPFVFDYKGEYVVTLVSVEELNSNIGSLGLESLLSRKVHRPFPAWVIENTMSDFILYQKDVKEWERDFPGEFKYMYYMEGFEELSIDDFFNLSQLEKENFLSNEFGYLLVD